MKKQLFLSFIAAITLCLIPLQAKADSVTSEQLVAAYNAITDENNKNADGQLWYRIFTYCIDAANSEYGTTKYYLTTGGTLTTEESEAGSFNFIKTDDAYPGFANNYYMEAELSFHVKNSGSYFTNANRATGSNIRTSTNGRASFEAQVFFLNDEGMYAVRSTNSLAGTWWESSWWTVGGTGVACYTEPDETDEEVTHAQFIWELEVADADDVIVFDETETYYLSFIEMASGATYKHLLSPAYYAEVGYTDSLLHRTAFKAKRMQLSITTATNGVKNNFYFKDILSNKYIVPSEDGVSGTLWTVGDEPVAVVLEEVGEDIYLMMGETGGKANPWGNDTEPYAVGNYNGSNKVTLTTVSSEATLTAAYAEYIKPAHDAITANADENGELWYRIVTRSKDGASLGDTKYYLTTGGTLTTAEGEAGAFNFIKVSDATSGLSEMAFFVKNGARYFTNANKAAGNSIRTATNGRDTHEAQIFCMNAEGKFAVRSTNNVESGWWESSWWTVGGAGIACYSDPSDEGMAFIWELEPVAAVDDAVKFAEGKFYTVTLNKNISYIYLQSPKYNEDGDNVLRRTTNAEQVMKVRMDAVKGVKSGFTMQDYESGLYIVPPTDANNGSNWTISDTPATILFAELGTGIYSMQGEAGGFANAYGDDRENEGYRVANYTSPSQWKFERVVVEEEQPGDATLAEYLDAAYSDILLGSTMVYHIFTYSEDGKTFGTTKRYLTTNGVLTTEESEAGAFHFIPVEEECGGFTDYAFHVKHGAYYFTNADRASGERLLTSTGGRPTYEAQVFYENIDDDYRYAVRSTNALEGSYWENAWWTVAASETAGVVACYTQPADSNAVYIWELEETEATDILTFDEDSYYTIVLDKESVTHKYVQSPAYNAEDDYVVRRTASVDSVIKVKILSDWYEENAFTMQDSISGLYIVPAGDEVVGTDWIFSEESASVYLEQLSETVFTMRGEAGGYANAYGDDREAEGYRVANYGVASRWIISKAGSETDIAPSPAVGAEVSVIYDLQGRRLQVMGRGVNIVRGDDGKVFKVLVK